MSYIPSVINAVTNYRLIPNDTSNPTRTANRIALQAAIDNAADTSFNGKIGVLVPYGIYYFDAGVLDSKLDLNVVLWMRRRIHLYGESPLGTILRFPAGCVKLVVQYNSTVDIAGDAQYGKISDMRLESVSTTPTLNTNIATYDAVEDDHGILITCGGIHIERVQVGNMGGTGFLIDAANIDGYDVLNANNVSLANCISEQNGGKGFWVRNGDNNQGGIFHNCHGVFNAHGDWAEQSFLGNTIIAGASQSDKGPNKLVLGDPGGSTAHTVAIGMYNEGDDRPFVHPPTILIGGNSSLTALQNPYNNGFIMSGGPDGGCRNLFSTLYKHTTLAYTENETVSVGMRRRPSTIEKANGREYIVTSITSGVCGPEPDPYPSTVGGGDPDPPNNPSLVGAFFTSGGATFQEVGHIRSSLEARAYLDYPSGSTGIFLGLAKAEDGTDIQGWVPGDYVSGIGAGWWQYTHAANFSSMAMSISNARNNEAHNYTGAMVPWVEKLKLGVHNSDIIFQDVGTAAASSGARYQGDWRFNKSVYPGGPAAWQVTTAGTPGTSHPIYLPGTYKLQTTLSTPNQVIATHLLLAQAATILNISVVGNKKDTDEFITATFSVSVKRNASGNPILLGSDDPNIKKTAGLTINGTNGIHIAVNNTTDSIEVQVDPAEIVTLDWTTIVSASEGISP